MTHLTTQHNTTQHNTTQHNTTQHNTTQHNTTQDCIDSSDESDDNSSNRCVSPVPLLTPPHSLSDTEDNPEWPSNLVVDSAITKALKMEKPRIALKLSSTGLTPQLSGIAMTVNSFDDGDEGFTL